MKNDQELHSTSVNQALLNFVMILGSQMKHWNKKKLVLCKHKNEIYWKNVLMEVYTVEVRDASPGSHHENLNQSAR